MPGHDSFTNEFNGCLAGENMIRDASGGTLHVDRSNFLLIMTTGTGTRTLPLAATIPVGVTGTIINYTGSTIAVIAQADIDGGGTNTDVDLDDGEYAHLMVMKNGSGTRLWRGLWTTGDYAT